MDEDSESLPGLGDYSEAIREILEEAVPEIPWYEEIKGPALSADAAGTIFADEVKFAEKDKLSEEASITFGISIVVPDLQQISSPLETLAMKTRKALNSTDIMDGHVQSITFGIAQGQRGRNPGAAVLLYEVKANI